MKLSPTLCVVDVETTGPNPFVHDLLSVAFVPVVMPDRVLSMYVRSAPLIWTEFGRENFRKFDHDWNRLAVEPAEACRQIEEYFHDLLGGEPAILIGHNVGFDISFLRKLALAVDKFQLAGISHRSIDTHTLLYLAGLQDVMPMDAISSDAAFKYLGITPPLRNRHTALGDAIATRSMFLHLLALLDPQANETRRRLIR